LSLQKQLEVVDDCFQAIAMLHKPGLKDTSAFPVWNGAYTQLIQLEMMLGRKSNSAIIEAAQGLLQGSVAELDTAIPQMISAENKDNAMKAYGKLKEALQLFIKDVSNLSAVPEPAPEPESSATRTMGR
jgi:ABC-type transporter Mla subunit MlaD